MNSNKQNDHKSSQGDFSSKPNQGKIEVKAMDLDDKVSIDCNTAIQNLGSEDLFYMMLARFEQMTLESNMIKIGQAVEERHFPNMKTAAHSLKGASGYIGASRVHYACFYIQENFVNNNHEEMLDYYPALIEAVVEFKITSRQMLAKHQNKPYAIEPDHETTAMAQGYRVVKEQQSGIYFCLLGQQTVEERKAAIENQFIKSSKQQGTQGPQQKLLNDLQAQNLQQKAKEEQKETSQDPNLLQQQQQSMNQAMPEQQNQNKQTKQISSMLRQEVKKEVDQIIMAQKPSSSVHAKKSQFSRQSLPKAIQQEKEKPKQQDIVVVKDSARNNEQVIEEALSQRSKQNSKKSILKAPLESQKKSDQNKVETNDVVESESVCFSWFCSMMKKFQ